jgi:hypothetical protein
MIVCLIPSLLLPSSISATNYFYPNPSPELCQPHTTLPSICTAPPLGRTQRLMPTTWHHSATNANTKATPQAKQTQKAHNLNCSRLPRLRTADRRPLFLQANLQLQPISETLHSNRRHYYSRLHSSSSPTIAATHQNSKRFAK